MKNNNNDEMGASFGAFLTGIVIGAAAVFLSDEKNRKRIRATMDDWKNKAEQTREDIEDKANDLKQQGLDKVSDQLVKTEARVKKAKKA